MEFDKLISFLEKRLKSPLPGKEAHLQMAPQPLDLRRFDPVLPSNHRKSGVLLLFFPDKDSSILPMIKRPEYPGVHGGQVSLPGGKMEPEDPSIIHTALREAEEEIGVNQSEIQILGQLTDLYIPPSNFLVSPVVGFMEKTPELIPEAKEVHRIITTPVLQLLDKGIQKRKNLKVSTGMVLDTPYFEIDGEIVWGATAMILSELLNILSSEED